VVTRVFCGDRWELNVMTAPVPAHLARILVGCNGPVDGVAFSPDGRLLATAGRDGRALLWNPATGEQWRTLTCQPGPGCPVWGVSQRRKANRFAGRADRSGCRFATG
jgi:WD40 repeat protein